MSKKKYAREDIRNLQAKIKYVLQNKYFNLFMNSMEWEGLEDEAEDYIMKKFWSSGTIAAFDISNAEMLGFAPYAVSSYTMYDTPSTVQLINERNVPFIPQKQLTVNQDVVLGYFQRNHKSIASIVDSYIDRLVQVEMVINTNLQVNKIPYLIGIAPEDKQKAEAIINDILNNEVVVFADLESLNNVKVLANGSNYIIDKLYAYKNNVESELLTFLGIDNSQIDVDKLAVDQINANNDMINSNSQGFEKELQKFCDRIKDVLGYEISVKTTHKPVVSEHAMMDYDGKNTETKQESEGTE